MKLNLKKSTRSGAVTAVPPLVDTFANPIFYAVRAAGGRKRNADIMHSILDNLNVPTLITRLSDAEILYSNVKAQKYLGISKKSFHKISELYVNKKDYNAMLNSVKVRQKVEDFETTIKTFHGIDLDVHSSTSVIEYNGETCKLTSFKDVTAEKEYKYLATIDPLTGINNRRSVELIANAEINRSKRRSHDMSVLLLDADHFKKVNDTYGHSMGDKVLKSIADTISTELRKADIVGRIGGEEFVVILPETNVEKAAGIAERIRNKINSQVFTSEDKNSIFQISASIGISTLRHDDRNVDEILNRADDALYEAKENGRNRIETVG
ncbi:MAG: diguanylate cyclase [Alphaproteobacteria bacterium]|nr:diguanylate cyclase [Alphaproteobacteria bacterium]